MTDTTLVDLVEDWIGWAGLAFNILVLGCGVLGLGLSLMAFIALHRRVVEQNQPGGGMPWGPLFAIAIAGFMSVAGLVYGFATLVWSPAGS